MTTAFNPRLADVHLGSRHTNIQGPYFNWKLSFVVGRESVVGTATDGRSGDRIPVGAIFYASVQTGPEAQPASSKMGTGSSPGVKRQGRGVHHPHPRSVAVKERVRIYLYYSSGPSWPVQRWTLLF